MTQKELVKAQKGWRELVKLFKIDLLPRNQRMQAFQSVLTLNDVIMESVHKVKDQAISQSPIKDIEDAVAKSGDAVVTHS